MSEYPEFTTATLNFLNKPDRAAERVGLVFEDLDARGIPDVLLLQEVPEPAVAPLRAAADARGLHVYTGSTSRSRTTGVEQQLAVVTREPALEVFEHRFGKLRMAPLLSVRGERYVAMNTHFPWGGNAEQHRLIAALETHRVARRARQLYDDAIIVLGGDFNALPDAQCIRFLTGLDAADGHGAYWTSIWHAGAPFPTSRGDNEWARSTAEGVGIVAPELLPARTIDHLFTYGWNYGRPGTPLAVERWAEDSRISDHYGVYGHFYAPPVARPDAIEGEPSH